MWVTIIIAKSRHSFRKSHFLKQAVSVGWNPIVSSQTPAEGVSSKHNFAWFYWSSDRNWSMFNYVRYYPIGTFRPENTTKIKILDSDQSLNGHSLFPL